MKPTLRILLPALVLAALLVPASAGAAQRLVTIATPSHFVDPSTQKFAEGVTPKLRANVLLPDGYAANPKRRYPLLMLLHGAGGSYRDWALPGSGDIRNTARGLNAIVVMPEGTTGSFYTNWWNGGLRRDPAWERHIREALIPQIEKRFRIRRGRRWHTIAGLSMGGYGTLLTASQNPGYFGNAVTMSAFADPQRPQVVAAFPFVAGNSFEEVFGPVEGAYATGHNPLQLAPNLLHTRLDIYTGDGTPDPAVGPPPSPTSGPVETELKDQNDKLHEALQFLGIRHRYTVHLGVHDWPYWRADLKTAIRRGLFRRVAEHPGTWIFRTVSTVGRMWSLHFRFAKPPRRVITFARDGHILKGAGGGRVTIRDGRGCKMTVKLPFNRQFPPARCR